MRQCSRMRVVLVQLQLHSLGLSVLIRLVARMQPVMTARRVDRCRVRDLGLAREDGIGLLDIDVGPCPPVHARVPEQLVSARQEARRAASDSSSCARTHVACECRGERVECQRLDSIHERGGTEDGIGLLQRRHRLDYRARLRPAVRGAAGGGAADTPPSESTQSGGMEGGGGSECGESRARGQLSTSSGRCRHRWAPSAVSLVPTQPGWS